MAITCWILISMRNISVKSCRENLNTHFMFNNFPRPTSPQISYRIWGHVERCGTERQATDDNVADAHCMMDNSGYKYVFRTRNNHCSPTATMVTRTRLSVTLPVLFLLKTRDFLTGDFRPKFCNSCLRKAVYFPVPATDGNQSEPWIYRVYTSMLPVPVAARSKA